MSDNGYRFSGIEKISVAGVPDFERTSTFYLKATVINETGSDVCYLWQNDGAGPQFRGLWIRFVNDGATSQNKILIDLVSDSSTGNRIEINSTNEVVPPGVEKVIEIWYDGSSTAAGFTVDVDSSNVAMTTINDNLTATTLTGSAGYAIGQPKGFISGGGYILMDLSFTIDSVLEFSTECDDKGLTVNDLSAQGNDGSIALNGSTTFYIPSYGEKYNYVFWWNDGAANNKYKVSFFEKGYTGGITALIPGPKPWLESIKGQLDTADNPILGSEAKMEILIDGAGYTALDADLLASDYKDFIVKLIQDPDGTPVIKWVGILLPASASRNYVGQIKTYSITAVDGLADLKNKSFSTTGLNDGSQYTGFETFIEIIKIALATVADIVELQLDFRINLGTYTDQMTNVTGLLHTDQLLKDNEVPQELFSEIVDNETKFDSCYEVLEKILIAFDCTFMQDDGYYYIICTGEKNTRVWEYDWSTLTEQSLTAWTKSVDASTYVWFGQGSLYKTPPYKSYDVRLYNKNYDAELIVNGGFDSNIIGWTLGDADDDSDGFSGISHITDGATGGVLRAEWGGGPAAGDYHFHTTNSFTVDISSELVTVTSVVELHEATPGGIAMPNLRFRLWNATDGYTVGNNGYISVIQIGGYYTYTETFDVSGLAVAANFLDVEAQVTDANTTSINLYYADISSRQSSAETPSDWLYTGLRSTAQPKPKEQIIYISEQQESDNDICAVKDSGGTYVSTWGRWNFPSETRPLIEILQQYRFNSNRDYMSYIRGTIYDPDETIDAKNVITLPDGDFRIIGMKKDYRAARVTLDLIQIIYVGLFLPPDTAFGIGKEKLNSQYGESQD